MTEGMENNRSILPPSFSSSGDDDDNNNNNNRGSRAGVGEGTLGALSPPPTQENTPQEETIGSSAGSTFLLHSLGREEETNFLFYLSV